MAASKTKQITQTRKKNTKALTKHGAKLLFGEEKMTTNPQNEIKVKGKVYHFEKTVNSLKWAEHFARIIRKSGKKGCLTLIRVGKTWHGSKCYHIYSRIKKIPSLED